MIRISQIKIPIDINGKEKGTDHQKNLSVLTKKASKMLRMDPSGITSVRIVKHSIDARKKPLLYNVYTIDVQVSGTEEAIIKKCREKNARIITPYAYSFIEKVSEGIDFTKDKTIDSIRALHRKVVVIGAGPAGLFCGYELAKAGFKVTVLERGADVDKRLKLVEKFWATGKLDEKTNVQFGEGGAGTFSDGKLNTMVKDKQGRGEEALDIFVRCGAPEKIKYESKPHIGTDILKDVVKNIRESIISAGGEVVFESQVTELITDDKGKLLCLKAGEKKYPCDAAVLAIGHSARDTFAMLFDRKVTMEPKPFAVGFRVEHPQSLINLSQYGCGSSPALPAAPYKLTTTTESGRGVYSFCMCPGGYVVNASSEEGRLCVNGMSYSSRDGENANSAIIITIDPKDFGSDHVLSGVEFQRKLEAKAYELAGGKIPVERYGDFKTAVLKQESSLSQKPDPNTFSDSFAPQMKGEYEFAPVHEILPSELNEAFVEGMENFGNIIKGYNDPGSLVSGIESRTSSPVRILRGEDGQSVSVKGLYPCGEGAGYAGGIMSAAMDGIRTAELVAINMLKDM